MPLLRGNDTLLFSEAIAVNGRILPAMVYFHMITDLRLHGSLGPVDFFTFVAGATTHNTYFYQEEPQKIRFFARGNEFTISEGSITYKGTGGSFCEYMFGVEKPIKDMEKGDILNRLVMFGAFLDENEHVVFTNNTEGTETFDRLFLQGHPVVNYYFIVSSDFRGEYRKRQKQILKAAGKFLKRARLLGDDRDTELLGSFSIALNEERSSIFLFKLINRANREYYDAFNRFYSEKRGLSPEDAHRVEQLALRYDIDRYQQERMKIDVMYRHPENRVVVDEYRDVLIRGSFRDTLQASEYARLKRLRTLSIRNDIPTNLFDKLDKLLLKDKKIQETEELEYIKDARAILENLFFKDALLKRNIIKEDIVRLIKAKHRAYSQNDRGFDQVLLDIGRVCDELSRETDDFRAFEEFSSIVTYFDRYDNLYSLLSHLAFMENIELREESLRSFMGNKEAFDALDENLFRSVFIHDLLENKYVTGYGKRKIEAILKGTEDVRKGEATIRDVVQEVKNLTGEEKLYHEIHAALKKRMRNLYPGLDTREEREKILEDIAAELTDGGSAPGGIPVRLFEKVFIDLRKESVYLNQIFPLVIRSSDRGLREDFLLNSGLDRFYVESLEREFFEEKGLDTTALDQLRGEKILSGVGGGERI
ncbi:MAG: TIGR04442 family protein [Candidatus Sulfobium sp.]|jgi:uncharacterized protein (TIGR04442 family)